jgi:hypothetical protein
MVSDSTIGDHADGISHTTVDGFLIEDWRGETTEHGWRFDTVVPFYQWKHHATAQGWLFYQNAWR